MLAERGGIIDLSDSGDSDVRRDVRVRVRREVPPGKEEMLGIHVPDRDSLTRDSRVGIVGVYVRNAAS